MIYDSVWSRKPTVQPLPTLVAQEVDGRRREIGERGFEVVGAVGGFAVGDGRFAGGLVLKEFEVRKGWGFGERESTMVDAFVLLEVGWRAI